MNTNTRYILPSMILLAVGTSVGAYAQATDSKTIRYPDNRKVQLGEEGNRALGYFSKMKGVNIRNQSNETVAELKDILFDRYSGDVAAYIVSDSRVIFPAELQATVGNDGEVAFRMNTTKDALKARMEFDDNALQADNATNSEYAAWWNRFSAENGKQGKMGEQSSTVEKFTNTSTVDVNGSVVSTHRIRGDGDAYRTVVEVKEKDGTMRTVVLGPTWYLADHRVMPMRGDTIAIKAAPIEDVDGATWAACDVKVGNGDKLSLRKGDSLAPTWYKDGGTEKAQTMQRRLLLASSIMGDSVKCREELSGEVDNLVIDFAGSRVVALVIDPNQNFLGMSDTTRMIPLSVATVSSDDLIFVDATKDMIVNAPAAPDKLQTLNATWDLDSKYQQRPTTSRR